MTQARLSFAALALVAAVALGSGAALAQSTEEATSRITIAPADGALEWQVENRSYDMVQNWPAGAEGPRTLLLEQTVSATRRSDLDGSLDPLVRVAAFEVSPDGMLTPAWALEAAAEGGAARYLGVFGDAYVATRYGCCGAFDAAFYFSLHTGAPLIVANGPVAMLEVPNSGGLVRIAGVETPWSITYGPTFENRPDLLGIVGYASMTDAIERVAIVVNGDLADTADSLMALPELEWVAEGEVPARELTLWALDGERDASKLSGVNLHIAYTPEAWVEIPLVGDRLDIEAATMAPILSLERLP